MIEFRHPVCRHLALAVLALAFLALGLFAAPAATAHDDHVVRLSGSQDPVTRLGWAILEEAYDRLGFSIELEVYPLARSLERANQGLTDGEVLREGGIEREHPNLIKVDVPIFTLRIMAYCLRDDIDITGWDSLNRYRVGMQVGITVGEETVGKHSQIFKVVSNKKLFTLLRQGRLDVVVAGELAQYDPAVSDMDFSRCHFTPLKTAAGYHYVHMRRASLVPSLTAVLKEMQRSGETKAIADQFLQQLTGEE